MGSYRRFMRYAVLFVFAASSLAAQTALGTGAVGGAVRDESGGYVAGARVVLTDTSKGLSRESESDAGGSFFFPSVAAAVYTLQAEKAGFKVEEIDGLKIEVGELASLSINLLVGAAHTVVLVSPPSSTELDSNSNTIGSVVDSERVQELPLNGREFLQLALLAGGALDLGPSKNLSTTNVGDDLRSHLPAVRASKIAFAAAGLRAAVYRFRIPD